MFEQKCCKNDICVKKKFIILQKKRILLKTQGFVAEPGNWNYVFNGNFKKGYCLHVCVYI